MVSIVLAQYYAPRSVSPTSVNSIGAIKTNEWTSDSTFETGSNYFSYDGWNHSTVTGRVGTTPATISGTLWNGTDVQGSTYRSGTHLGSFGWWDPYTTWTSGVQYQLSSPSAADPYYTPGGWAATHNSSTGFDNITERNIDWNYWYNRYHNAWGWDWGSTSNTIANAKYYYTTTWPAPR